MMNIQIKRNPEIEQMLEVKYNAWLQEEKQKNEEIKPEVKKIKNEEKIKKPLEISNLDVEHILLDIAMDGIIFNPTKAMSSDQCKCAKTTKGTLYCFKPGIIGALSQEQIKEFCPNPEPSFKFSIDEQKLDKITKISKECSYPRTENLEERLKCIFNKAEKQGIL
ncbi:MAG: hypothetical protein QW745_09065 [Thermoplasmata archaeon]